MSYREASTTPTANVITGTGLTRPGTSSGLEPAGCGTRKLGVKQLQARLQLQLQHTTTKYTTHGCRRRLPPGAGAHDERSERPASVLWSIPAASSISSLRPCCCSPSPSANRPPRGRRRQSPSHCSYLDGLLPLSPGKYPPFAPKYHSTRSRGPIQNAILLLCTLPWILVCWAYFLYSCALYCTVADHLPLLQRKTRCDPTLPRCLPCERSGSVCEYFDTARGKKISRFYVVKLQEKVRELEAELLQYTDDDNDHPESAEDIVRPGGLVKLNDSDDTPRYLGPSSGIAMTRLLMEQAKRYTDSQRISDLIPDVRARRMDRLNRMQSIVPMGASISGPAGNAAMHKNYPMISEHAAATLPSRSVADRLVEMYHARGLDFSVTMLKLEP